MDPEERSYSGPATEVAAEPEGDARDRDAVGVAVVLDGCVEVGFGRQVELFADAVRFVRSNCRTALGATVEREVDAGVVLFQSVLALES